MQPVRRFFEPARTVDKKKKNLPVKIVRTVSAGQRLTRGSGSPSPGGGLSKENASVSFRKVAEMRREVSSYRTPIEFHKRRRSPPRGKT